MLEYLGKDWKDVRYIDRAVASGEIIMRDRMYITSREYIEELEKNQTNNIDREPIVDKNINQKKIAELEEKVADLEYELSEAKKELDKWWDRRQAEKVYQFLTYQCHIDVDKGEFMEMLGF